MIWRVESPTYCLIVLNIYIRSIYLHFVDLFVSLYMQFSQVRRYIAKKDVLTNLGKLKMHDLVYIYSVYI